MQKVHFIAQPIAPVIFARRQNSSILNAAPIRAQQTFVDELEFVHNELQLHKNVFDSLLTSII